MKGKHTNMVKPKPGGAAPVAIPGVAVMHESKKGSSGFKKGGRIKGQMAGGECMSDGGRMDKTPRKARGGAATMRGRSPMSSASSTSSPGGGTTH
jgi:hypothetical protein